jgi:hypothetical protein
MRALGPTLVLCSGILACGSPKTISLPPPGGPDASAGPDGSAGADAGSSSDASPSPDAGQPPGTAITLTLEPFSVNAGTERQVCKVVNLPSSTPFDVVRFHSTMGANSHHLNVYKVLNNTSPVTPADGMIHDCAPASEQLSGNAAYIFGSAIPERVVQTPAGVAFRLAPQQQIILEQHIINATEHPTMGGASFDITAATSSISHFADIVWMGYWAIALPAGQTTSATGHCSMPYNITVFGLNSHTHSLGVDFTIAGSTGGMLYENTDWSHPLYKTFDPAFQVASGQGFSWTCTWNNTTNHVVTAGRNSTDEMCIAFAYAYPTDTPSANPIQCNDPFTP